MDQLSWINILKNYSTFVNYSIVLELDSLELMFAQYTNLWKHFAEFTATNVNPLNLLILS